MAITTYFSQRDVDAIADDPILAPLLEELSRLTGQRWVAQSYPVKRRFHKSTWRWCLYKSLGATFLGDEYQVINFYRDNTGTSINTCVTKELIVAFLYGYLNRET